ncbi:MAG: helix-turn-helix transcriptional regulator [Steroidobacterales bacterium]
MSPSSVIEQRGVTQRRLLQALQKHPAGLSVDSLTLDLGITANAVRQHLTALERDGLIIHEVARASRGRPLFLYQLSELGQEAFPRRYRELAEAVLSELGDHLGNTALVRSMRRMGERAAQAANVKHLSVGATSRIMKQLGYETEARTSAKDGDEIVARNCVFHRLAQRFPAVCEFDLGFMESATGRKVEHRECMVRGGSVCRFKLSEPPKPATRK